MPFLEKKVSAHDSTSTTAFPIILLNYRMKNLHFLNILVLTGALFFLSCQESNPIKEKKDLSLNSLFSNHMVLQQQDEVVFWGSYNPSGEVTISGSWGEETSATSDAKGNWKLNLSTPSAGGPFEVKIVTLDSTIVLNDVLVGEVWLASGQSNMEMPLQGFLPNEPVDNYQEEVAAANYPEIRYFDVTRAIAASPEKEFVGQWKITSPETASQFSAAGYFFARKLHQELGVPIGVITSSWGGTPVESWMSKEKIATLNEFGEALEALKEENIKAYKDWYSKFPVVVVSNTPEESGKLDLGDADYATSDFNDSDWGTTSLTKKVEDLGSTSTDGIFWFRKSVIIDDISSDYTFSVSKGIDDMDITYVNGKEVGSSSGWNTPRSYVIPKSILTKGENLFAVRVFDNGGGGGFMGEVNLTNNTSGKQIPITDGWKFNQHAGIEGSNFLLFGKNIEALKNPPAGIESFKLDSHTPTVLYNGMIHPLIPYNIKGAIWYQGESNVGRDKQYLKLFPGMIEDWRERWNSDFSFYFVQIAPFTYNNELSPALRDAQRKSLKTPKTGMAITMDIGLPKSIHPGNKQDVGDRLARLALAKDYGKNILASGPLYESHSISGNKIIVEFNYSEGGLMTKESGLSGFEIAGDDKKFRPAKAKIVDNKIEVSSASVKQPKYVRYGWKDFINGTLFNNDELPASSFTTED